jgi:hypothetical protein
VIGLRGELQAVFRCSTADSYAQSPTANFQYPKVIGGDQVRFAWRPVRNLKPVRLVAPVHKRAAAPGAHVRMVASR